MRYVIAVADEGGFQSAARRLNMAQPPLSRQIRDLERQLGVVLFERRPTRLTEAGRQFVASARRIVEDADRLVRELGQGGSVELTGTVRVGYLPAAGYDTVPMLERAVAEEHPGITLEAVRHWAPDRALLDGEVEVVLTRCAPAHPRLARRTLRGEHLVALLPATHPKANAGGVTLRDLRGHTFCYFPRRRAPAYHDAVMAALSSTGENFTVWEHPIPNDPLNFTVIPSSTVPHVPDGLAVLPILDPLPAFDLELLWNARAADPVTGAVVATALLLARREGWTDGEAWE
ncbi:LysR family transcriptional regulator [Actinocorallia libanotica]|uniref:LysR substrate-binding domain-containing protein n=1 Tax=Actinocorallia libanotica TaxID=46162 RepID=A0ABN1QCW2_9ACTN